MYIDYSRLWALLAKRGMTKNDLSKLTGISSRVMAKLTKCETVTTDTVARICEALECNVGDIMECRADGGMTLYECYRRLGKVTSENELYKTVEFSLGETHYTLHVTKKAAGRATHIHCRENGTVCWEQLYPMGGMSRPSSETHVLIRPKSHKNARTVVIIRGKPASITGLDEGIFVSAKREATGENDVYVMSEAAFKLFDGK